MSVINLPDQIRAQSVYTLVMLDALSRVTRPLAIALYVHMSPSSFSVAVRYTKLMTPSAYAFEGNVIRSTRKVASIVLHDGIIVQTALAAQSEG